MCLLVLPSRQGGNALDLRVHSPPLLYPSAPAPGAVLPDVVLEIRVRSGVLGLPGTRTRVRLRHRTVRNVRNVDPRTPGRYGIESEIDTTVYFLGLPLKHSRFQSQEKVDGGELVNHRLRFADDSSSVLEPAPSRHPAASRANLAAPAARGAPRPHQQRAGRRTLISPRSTRGCRAGSERRGRLRSALGSRACTMSSICSRSSVSCSMRAPASR